jgi:hypothetical protein
MSFTLLYLFFYVQPLLAQEYEQNEQENGGQAHSGANKIIYDCMDNSPYYDKNNTGSGEGPYLEEGD